MPSHCLKGSRRRTLPTRPRTFYNPVGFDPAEVLPLHLHRYADHARFFLHVLYSQGCSRRSRMSSSRSRRHTCGGSSPATKSINRSGMPSWSPGRSSAMGSAIKPIRLTWRNHSDRHRGGKCFGYKLGPRWEGVRHEKVVLNVQAVAQVDHQDQQGTGDRDRHPASPAHLGLSPGHHDRSRCCRTGT